MTRGNEAMELRGKPDREALLRPFLDALGCGRIEPAHPESMESWERDVLGDVDDETPWRVHVRESHAWHALVQQHLNAPDGTAPVHATLADDAVVGFAVACDLQHEVDAMVLGGEMQLAKRLSSYKNRFTREIDKLEEWLGAETLGQCRGLGRELSESARAAARVLASTEPDPAAAEEAARKAREARLESMLEEAGGSAGLPTPARFEKSYGNAHPLKVEPGRRSPLPWLLAVVAVLAIAWIVRVGVPMWTAEPLPTADYAQLDHPAILQVAPHSPTVYVTVDRASWNALDEDARYEVVDSARRLLEPQGFQGAWFRTSDGTTVGQWLAKTGVKTFEARSGT